MKWQDIIKEPSSPQGLHVTKFYMFLKRWLADTQTEQFSKYFIPYDELDIRDKRRVYWALDSLLIHSVHSVRQARHSKATDSKTPYFPGITVRTLTDNALDLGFNDAKHISERDYWVNSSREAEQNRKYVDANYKPWWYKAPPYDQELQDAWNKLSNVIKRSKNYGNIWFHNNK